MDTMSSGEEDCTLRVCQPCPPRLTLTLHLHCPIDPSHSRKFDQAQPAAVMPVSLQTNFKGCCLQSHDETSKLGHAVHSAFGSFGQLWAN